MVILMSILRQFHELTSLKIFASNAHEDGKVHNDRNREGGKTQTCIFLMDF